jgi:hypothetical protein
MGEGWAGFRFHTVLHVLRYTLYGASNLDAAASKCDAVEKKEKKVVEGLKMPKPEDPPSLPPSLGAFVGGAAASAFAQQSRLTGRRTSQRAGR